MTHDFNESLRLSHTAENFPFWEECYRKFFPDFQTMISHRQDGEHQRAGIDRSVILSNSKQVLVDEKIRWKDYPDIALEEFSDEERRVPGWVMKPLRCDYIAYAIAPTGRCYLLPLVQLQAAWRLNRARWKVEFPFMIRARNNGYTTLSYGIPVPVLFKAIGDCLRCQFTPVTDWNSQVNQIEEDPF